MTEENNEIKIGQKDYKIYISGIEYFFRKENKSKVILKARGMNIKKAIDLAESAKNHFMKDMNVSIEKITTSTSEFINDKEKERTVSCIEIELKK